MSFSHNTHFGANNFDIHIQCQHWFEGHSCPCCCQQCRGGSVAKDELILLHVEEQAIVQVIIRDVAKYLDIKDNSKINTVRKKLFHLQIGTV